MVNGELLRVARSSWDAIFERPPIDMGIEQGIVWAIVASPAVGVNGYAMIPAEGHPWSASFPRGEDSIKDAEISMRNMRLLHEIMKRKPDIAQAWAELKSDPDYEERSDYSLDDFLDVHGGVTFYQHPWVGFDTGHAYDRWDAEYDPSGLTGRFARWGLSTRQWTAEMVIEEAKGLARQLAEIGELERTLGF